MRTLEVGPCNLRPLVETYASLPREQKEQIAQSIEDGLLELIELADDEFEQGMIDLVASIHDMIIPIDPELIESIGVDQDDE